MKIVLLASVLFVLGCAKDSISKLPTDNKNIDVGLMFTHEGCKMYRFYDEGRSHYFTNCTETISSYTENCGKNCIKTISENIRGSK